MINSYTTTENGLIGGITESNNTLVVCNSEVQVVSKSEQEKVVNGYKVSKDKTTPYSTLSFTAVQLKDGIKTIVLPDNTTVQFNNDLMATATYSISETGTYTFKIIDTKGKQTEQTINVKSIKNVATGKTNDCHLRNRDELPWLTRRNIYYEEIQRNEQRRIINLTG